MSNEITYTACVNWGGEHLRFPLDVTRDPLAELEAWRVEHKAHQVEISRGDDYGADFWEVVLGGVLCPSLGVKGSRVSVRALEWCSVGDDVTWHEGIVYTCDDYVDGDWVGPGPTILAAIDQARRIERGELK